MRNTRSSTEDKLAVHEVETLDDVLGIMDKDQVAALAPAIMGMGKGARVGDQQ